MGPSGLGSLFPRVECNYSILFYLDGIWLVSDAVLQHCNTWELQFGAWMRILIDAPERIIIIADKRILALFNTMLYTAKC